MYRVYGENVKTGEQRFIGETDDQKKAFKLGKKIKKDEKLVIFHEGVRMSI